MSRWRISFFHPPSSGRYSAASLSRRLGLDRHSYRGSKISPVFVSHSLLAWPLLFPLRSASTFRPQEQIQDSSGHEGTSSVVSPLSAFLHPTYLCQARGCCAEALALQDKQREHCVYGRVDKHVSLWVHPHFYVFIQETGPPCWLHRLVCYGCACSPTYSGFLHGWVQIKTLHFYIFLIELWWEYCNKKRDFGINKTIMLKDIYIYISFILASDKYLNTFLHWRWSVDFRSHL